MLGCPIHDGFIIMGGKVQSPISLFFPKPRGRLSMRGFMRMDGNEAASTSLFYVAVNLTS